MTTSLAKPKPLNGEADQQLQRVDTLHQQLKAEHARAQELLARLKGEEYQAAAARNPPPPPPKAQDWVRDPKALDKKVAEFRKRAEKLEKAAGVKNNALDMGLPELKAEEREIRDLEARVSGLEGRVRGFEGLPPDKELALLEVEKMRKELEALARRRDAMFEGLVEGEK
ncbi:MAG: hypothetical protein Q9212_002320 [Teloschistes hypoglaucus]